MQPLSVNLNPSKVQTIIPDALSSTRRDFLTPIPDLPGEFLLVLDNTSLDKIKRCHKAGENYLILGREAPARNAALVFGGAVHEGFELFHEKQWLNANSEHSADDHCDSNAQDQAIIRFFTDNPPPHDEYRTVNSALEVLKHYRRRSDINLHPDYELEILADDNGPIIERAFELPLTVLEGQWEIPNLGPVHKIHLAWSGRIDMIVKVNGRNRILDHKTTSVDGPNYLAAFELSSQVRGYVWAARQLWPDLDVKSFCLNAVYLKKPTLGQTDLMARGPKGGEPPLKFYRAYFPTNSTQEYSDEALARWERDTILTIEDFLHSMSRGVFPLNDRACVEKYGVCSYHQCCTMDNEIIGHRLLMSDAYKQVTWNPTNGR